MKIAPFATEQFFAPYEFSTPHLLSVSDCETVSVEELLALAGMEMADLGRVRLGYTESQGNPRLREQIAAGYETVKAGEIVVLTSPVEGIYLTMRTLLEPGDEVIVLMPAYDALKNMAEHITGRVKAWQLKPKAGGWALDFEVLEHLLTARTRLIVVNFPHNPTGFLPTPADFDRLIRLAGLQGSWLFCDEMYRGLEFGAAGRLSSAADRYGRAIVLAGLSKSHGLPGLRAGWLVVRDEKVRRELINWKFYTTICPAAPSEFLAMAALAAGPALLTRSQETIRNNLALAEPFFARHTDFFDWRPPQAGSVALVGLDVPSASEYCHHLAQTAGVLLLPGPCLGADDRQVRFGFGRASFPAALAHYETILTKPDII